MCIDTNNVDHFTVFTKCSSSIYRKLFKPTKLLWLYFSREDYDDVLRDMAFRSSISIFLLPLKNIEIKGIILLFFGSCKNLYNQPTGRGYERERLRASTKRKKSKKNKKKLEFIELKFAKHSVRCFK